MSPLTFRAVRSRPLSPADALSCLEVEFPVSRAVREALPGLPVQLGAVGAAPTLAADAGALHAEAVAGAARVGAVSWGEMQRDEIIIG